MTTILKLGGSVITEKDGVEKIDAANLARAVHVIAEADVEDLVIVHGGGSFGHHHANKHDVSTTAGSHDPDAVLDIHEAMKRLNEVVVNRLNEEGVPAVPVHPLSAAARDEEGALTLATTAVETLLGEGFVPVLHGDVIAHAGEGVTVVSGDELVTSLARSLAADRVGLCSGVPGVLDESDTVIDEIDSFEAVAPALGGSDATDVSGGMAGKVRELLALGSPADIFGLDGLAAFLAGESPGTRIDGRTD
ncbi:MULTISPECIES: isopentenyl phosphate kinase [unclassified Haladaptatus]|uniref:isopentenyl phosphate kinase n=1 Tax=unclassified Haladaptatus TaxID=2622732 RepID=UPI0023E8540F|nr:MULTISPECIES: isopentenyl phosphate kinase [unclassified Haladaptatus]